MSTATPCGAARCRRVTRDASGKCHDHRRSPVGVWVVAASPDGLPSPEFEGFTKTVEKLPDTTITTYKNADGEPHRIDGPAVQIVRKDGAPHSEEWMRNGLHHRVGGPAWTSYRRDGTLLSEDYYRKGELFRLDGRASTQYLADGKTPDYGSWCFGSDYFDHPGPFIAAVREKMTEDELVTEIMATPLAELYLEGRSVDAILDGLASGAQTPDGVREVLAGAPAEWVIAYEEGRS